MSAYVFLILLNELEKRNKSMAVEHFFLFLARSLINSIMQEIKC